MRSEILQRIQDLLQNEDLEAIRKDVRADIDSFRSLIKEDFRAQREAWEKEEHEAEDKFQFEPALKRFSSTHWWTSSKSEKRHGASVQRNSGPIWGSRPG